jgi:hypothetical protein
MISAHIALGGVALDLLDWPTAQQHFDQMARLAEEIGSAFMISWSRSWRALTAVARQDLTAARPLLGTSPDLSTPPRHLAERYRWYAHAQAALATEAADQALALVNGLIAATPQVDY